jgi:hypothetical protein
MVDGRTALRRWRWLAVAVASVSVAVAACSRRPELPAGLGDAQWWTLIQDLSEPAGPFDLSENFVSNEPGFAESVRWLRPSGGAYIGVGPEQNFSYIAGLRPSIAFIIDIRRENLNLHLLYKALFELSTDRADFVSRLFSRPRPAGLAAPAPVDDIFTQFETVRPSPEQHARDAALVRDRLLSTRGLPLGQADLEWIDRAFQAFFAAGPAIHFWGSRSIEGRQPSYRSLMTARDTTGRSRSFLESDEAFRYVQDLHRKNLIVPIVGDFGGRTAMRRVADYVRERGGVVHAVYASNVAVYLSNEQARAFCRNLAYFPAAPRAWFIESNRLRTLAAKLRSCPTEG